MLVKVPGVRYPFPGGQVHILAPLSAGHLRTVLQRSAEIKNTTDPANVDLVVDAVHASLSRNYPGVTREYVENELVDAANMAELMQVVMQASGAERTNDDGVSARPGEALWATSSTGTPSSPESVR